MRKRIVRDRKAASAKIAFLRPLTGSRFDGVERHQPDENAKMAIAKLRCLSRCSTKPGSDIMNCNRKGWAMLPFVNWVSALGRAAFQKRNAD